MRRTEIKFTAAAILLLAFLYYIAEPYEIAAVALAAAVHELGHICAIKLLGLHVKEFRTELKGFCINYFGYTGALGHMLIAACGPAAGFIYAGIVSRYASLYESPFLALSSGTSFILSVFNMLPALPLDGGRIMAQLFELLYGANRGAKITRTVSSCVSGLLMALGLYLMLQKRGMALLISSIWLLFYQEDAKGIVKAREIL